LLSAWRNGLCKDWQFVRNLFDDFTICKVASNIKQAIQCLREKDVIVDGEIYDPTVAFSLCPTDETTERLLSTYSTIYHQLRLCWTTLAGRTSDTALASIQTQRFQHSQCLSSSRCYLMMQAMVDTERLLTQYELYDIFNNIEMPVLITVAEMEFNGMVINTYFTLKLRDQVQDRQKMIEYYFESFYGKEYNVDSPADMRLLKERWIQQMQDELSSAAICGVDSHLEGTIVEEKSKSDWSFGKEYLNQQKKKDKDLAPVTSKKIGEIIHPFYRLLFSSCFP
jgi:DNA polymerase I-like protein with 3'-5' exonuclease and polymerase domains